jgi:hypothetical protein
VAKKEQDRSTEQGQDPSTTGSESTPRSERLTDWERKFVAHSLRIAIEVDKALALSGQSSAPLNLPERGRLQALAYRIEQGEVA